VHLNRAANFYVGSDPAVPAGQTDFISLAAASRGWR